MVTDYDCWHDDHEHVTVEAVNQGDAAERRQCAAADHGGGAQAGTGAPGLPAGAWKPLLDMALITAPDKRDPALMAKLDAVAGRVLRK